MNLDFKFFTSLVLFFLGLIPFSVAAWPDRPVRLIVPYTAGGNVDVAARVAAEGLQKIFGQTFYVENRAGAGGLIAADYVANATPDGYTFLVGANGPVLFAPVIAGRLDFDWRQKFDAVGPLTFTPLVLQTRSALGVKTVVQFVELAKKKNLNMGSGGAGSTNHLSSELLQSLMGTKWTTAHYRGNAMVVTALLGGEVDFAIEQISVALPMIKDGRMQPVAVTSRSRSPLLPDVPTLHESGFDSFEAVTWTGLFAPRGTPPSIVAQLNVSLAKVLAEPAIVKRFGESSSEMRTMSVDTFSVYVNRENEKWLPIVKRLNLTN
jgi:tripartite-type tricarboxylate transporter receptor subunit TctC